VHFGSDEWPQLRWWHRLRCNTCGSEALNESRVLQGFLKSTIEQIGNILWNTCRANDGEPGSNVIARQYLRNGLNLGHQGIWVGRRYCKRAQLAPGSLSHSVADVSEGKVEGA